MAGHLILFRYFAREVFLTMFTVAGIVLVISMGWRFSGYLNQAAAGMMTKEVLFALMAFRLPGFLELITPVSFFLAVMLTYGRLYVDHEMIVLQSCGMSPSRLTGMTLVMAFMVMLLTATISLWIKPMGEREVETLLQGQRNLTEFDTLVPGRFQSLSSGRRVTYSEGLSGEGELKNVFINEYRDPESARDSRNSATVIAESGKTEVDELGRRFLVLNRGTRYQGKPGEKGYQVVSYEEYGQLVEKGNRVSKERRSAAIPTVELMSSTDPSSLSEFHWRVSVVLMIPVIALLAIPLSKVKPRQGRFTRLVPAMVLCFLYVIALSGARSGLERGDLPISLGLWWVHGIFLAVTVVAWQLERASEFVNRMLRA
ncbi:MAG: LPS export ABC transporter permease LptF [Gammaproteobacteria bacterium]|nr:LPS export ABC transporter permease LptF [Gammaproteobacteria bacterium]MBT4493131.1 LPS export ABC transporter permease LptF [Gammaproteobacteria bacterium]MBT7371197.1 LPS export ABC transporter permease LptF [Gammaproteobacteria bacterium]